VNASSSADGNSPGYRALVTGAAGFIGSNLACRLAADRHDVVAADWFRDGSFRNLTPFLRDGGDVLTLPEDPAAEVAALRDAGPFDVIYHQASITGVINADGSAATGPEADRRMLLNNVEQFRRLLRLAEATGAALVWASSCSVYGRGPVPMKETADYDPLNSYAFSKVAMERLADKYAPRLAHPPVGLRYSNVYGPGEDHKGPLASMIHKLAKTMRAGDRPRIFEHGEQRRDFVYVDDAVEANLAAYRALTDGHLDLGRGYAINAGAGRSWTFNEVVAELNRVLGTSLPPEYFKNPYDFTQDHTETDQSLAKELIGHEPRFDLATGLDAYEKSGKLGKSA
jgi:ADP-L-glycero-D-manno-heptose 6-epimerase